MKEFHSKKLSDVYKELNTSKTGLTDEEAENRLKLYGENKLKEAKKKTFIQRFFAQFKDIMIILLIVSAGISLVFSFFSKDGSSELIDAVIILVIVILNATLGVVQEQKAENAMESLKKMSQPYSKVIRNGKEKLVKTSELVIGDIVKLEAGDIIPADLRFIECASLKCDESMITGESVAVEKDANASLKDKTALGDRINMGFSSTIVANGRGLGVVVATGQNAEIGKIASMLTKEKESTSTLQRSLNKFGKIITVVVLVIAAIIFLVDIFVAHQNWTESLMTAVAIAVAAIPESLMMVVTIILSIGVTRLAKKNVIMKRLHSVETLGCCQVICSDKTGTITQNKMTVRSIAVNEKIYALDSVDIKEESTIKLINNMLLCNDAHRQSDGLFGDPTETALIDFGEKFGFVKTKHEKTYKRINELPFDSNRKLMSTINQNANGELTQYTKGAVDKLLDRCKSILINGKVRKITAKDKEQIKSLNDEMCSKALRVLAYAEKQVESKDNLTEEDLTFVGLSGMIDPPRDDVYEALIKCKQAGMRPVMITGDHKGTAYAIAKELGIVKNISEVVDGSYLDQFTDEELKHEIYKFQVFSRVSPEHKVRIVKAYRANGKVVAMTGDGVNDAPSIKSANIGIGMGISGTEVTKEVSDMVLTDDNFATIVIAVEEGRKIYTNIQKTIQFLLGGNIAEVLSIFVLTLLFPSVTFLVAIQILFINLISDTLPAIALGMETVEHDVMKQKPRNINQGIISGRVGFNLLYQGLLQGVVVIAVFIIAQNVYGSAVASTMGFLTLDLIQLVYMFNVRTNGSIFKSNPFKNKMLLLALFVGLGLVAFVAFIPPVASVFHIISLTWQQWLMVIGAVLSIIPIVEVVKLIQYFYYKRKNKESE